MGRSQGPIVVVGAGWFPSSYAAAKVFGTSPQVVRRRVRSPKHPGWRQAKEWACLRWHPPPTPAGGWRKALGIKDVGSSASVACTADGVEYASYQEAGRVLGMSGPAVRARCQSTTPRFESWRFWDPKRKRWV